MNADVIKTIFKYQILLVILVCNLRCVSHKTTTTNQNNSIEKELNTTIYKVSNSIEFIDALSKVSIGETILLKGGIYVFSNPIKLKKSGNSKNKITITFDENDERPLFDFSSMEEDSSNKGIQLNGSYWHINGLKIVGAGDNGMLIKGNNNTIEYCSFSECSDTGLQLGSGASNNTILNCDSFFNADSSLENADGFACKLDVGTGNKFIGCRAWNNLDDGWDGYLRGVDNITTTYKNCWAIQNGYLKNGTIGKGDGNGFKTGGSDNKLLKHNAIYTNCIVVGNTHDGFDHNSNRGTVEIYNSITYDNGRNFAFSEKKSLAKINVKNCVTIGSFGKINAISEDISHNSWQLDKLPIQTDFKSIDYSELKAERKSNGDLPEVYFFKLKEGSKMIDAGIDVGLPFKGIAPDIGGFETN